MFVLKRVETFSCIEIGFLMIRAFCPLCSEYKVRDSFLFKLWAHLQAVEKRGEEKRKVGQLKYNTEWRQENMFLGNTFIVGRLDFINIVPPQLTQSWTHFEAGIK